MATVISYNVWKESRKITKKCMKTIILDSNFAAAKQNACTNKKLGPNAIGI